MKKQTTRTTTSGKGRVDLAKLEATTEADIERHMQEDDEVAWTPEMLRRTHSWRPGKEGIHIRLDPDVLDFFRRQGRGYQSRINAVLRAYVDAHARKAT